MDRFSTLSPLDFLDSELDRIAQLGLLRDRNQSAPEGILDVCSNDYLGYGRRPVSRETLTASAGAGASRLIHGTRAEHRALEAEFADWMGTEDALLFPTGYAANIGVISALAGPGDLIVSDALNHASTIDGCRLARARTEVVPHRDLAEVRRALALPVSGRRWMLTESYFSMDANSPDLRALRGLCDEAGAALIVDEAHALGLFGPGGAGLCAADGVKPDVVIGTLGKAVGVQGAFVAGTRSLTAYLWNRARSFVFTTAPSPLVTAVALEHVRALRRDDASREQLLRLCSAFERDLGPLRALFPPDRHGPIFPLLFGTPDRARAVATALTERGFLALPIRPPTVPEGTSRLRLALRSTLPPESVAALARTLLELCPAP
jgi:8-amino-7-oxononanoate synthase